MTCRNEPTRRTLHATAGNTKRPLRGRRLRVAATLLLLCAIAPIAASAAEPGDTGTIDLYGTSEAKLAWAPAEGPVEGYYVIVSRNQGEPAVDGVVADPQASIVAEFGDSIVVTVSAFDASGVPGPASEPSPTIVFHASSEGGGSGDPPPSDEGDPPDEGEGDPPGDGGDPPDGPPVVDPATASDFTGDGISDLPIHGDEGLTIYAIEPGATPTELDVPDIADDWRHAGGGDLDGNGAVDLVIANDDSGIAFALLFTNGIIEDGGTIALDETATIVGLGDLDGDGRDDIVRRSKNGEAVRLLFMNGLEEVGRLEFEAFATENSVAAIADFDGDGAGEILWLDDTERWLTLWDLKGGTVDAAPLGELGDGWSVVGAGDFDADGAAEIFVHHGGAATLEVWRVAGGSVIETIALPNAAGFDPMTVGDFDGDGRSDLVLMERSTRQIEAWMSDGSSVTTSVLMEGASDPADDPVDRLCAADFDGDGRLDHDDFVAMKTCLGAPGTGTCAFADLDGNGKVTRRDFRLFKQSYGETVCR